MTELWRLDSHDQAALIRSGEVSAGEVMDATLARIAEVNPTLNAVVCIDPQSARERAKHVQGGAFAGVPFLAKDLLGYPSLRAAMGCRLFDGYVPAEHVPYTARIEASGLVCVGKTATSELGLLGSTETQLEGVTRNPWGADLSACGSSGGSAAAVAAGLVPVAHASDGGGSIRLPAALHGLFGFKPSAGATVPAAPPSEFVRLASEHCISRSVRDSDAFFAATRVDPGEPFGPAAIEPLRIGWYDTTAFGVQASAESRAALEHAVTLCTALGHHVERVDPPPISGAAISHGFFSIAGAAVAGIRDLLGAIGPTDVEPFTWALMQRFEAQGSGAYEARDLKTPRRYQRG